MNFTDPHQLPPALQSALYYRDLSPKQILFSQGDRAKAMFVVESGSVILLNYTEDGTEITRYRVECGESFAELGLFREIYPSAAIADRPTRVLVLPKQPFLEAIEQSPKLTKATIERLAQRLERCERLLDLRGIRSAQQRVLHYLNLLKRSNERSVILDRPFKDIAMNLGLTPETLSRELVRLQELGKITRNRRKIDFC